MAYSSNITFSSNGLGFWTDQDNYRVNIVATDYGNFAVGASCSSRYGSDVWVFTRNTQISPDVYTSIINSVDQLNFNMAYLIQTKFDAATCAANQLFNDSSFLFIFNLSLIVLFKLLNNFF